MKIIPPGSTIGILGGGQLGRMLALAAAELGYHTHIYTDEAGAPACEVARACTVGGYEDFQALEDFAAQVDVVTLEFENISCNGVRHVARKVAVHPGAEVLAVCQHRVREKECIRALGVQTAPFVAVDSMAALTAGMQTLGLPCVLKTCRMGYDGKGQAMLENAAQAEAAWAQLRTDDAILEGFVRFTMEISVIVARGAGGEMAAYVPVQNIHRHHMLHQTIAPAPLAEGLRAQAEDIARRIAEGLGLVGILAVEMFVGEDGALLVNELAPRPHNSGHWTMDACAHGQFEQTIRAVCGLPLGEPQRFADAVMTNLIGDEVHAWQELLARPHHRVHLYGKKEARAGRKMGHVTELKGL